MRILMVSSVFPLPALTGGLIRIFHVLRGLSKYHEVTFVSPIESGSLGKEHELEKETAARIHTIPWRSRNILDEILSVFGLNPYHVRWYRCRQLNKIVADLLSAEKYDLIYVHFLRALQYLPVKVNAQVVLDQHNAEQDMWALRAKQGPNWMVRLISKANLWKTLKYENKHLSLISAYVSVSDQDRESTQTYAYPTVQHYMVAPNGVETNCCVPAHNEILLESRESYPTIAYMGSMDVPSNIDAVLFLYREILPLVMQKADKLRFLIIGRNPVPRIRKLQSKDGLYIVVTGTVNDVSQFLKQADVFVAPITYGGGTKLKVLQAMSMQIPVVGTTHAAQGLKIVDGEHMMIGHSPQMLADKVVQLLRDKELRWRIGSAGRKLVVKHYSWDSIAQKLSQELEALLQHAETPPHSEALRKSIIYGV